MSRSTAGPPSSSPTPPRHCHRILLCGRGETRGPSGRDGRGEDRRGSNPSDGGVHRSSTTRSSTISPTDSGRYRAASSTRTRLRSCWGGRRSGPRRTTAVSSGTSPTVPPPLQREADPAPSPGALRLHEGELHAPPVGHGRLDGLLPRPTLAAHRLACPAPSISTRRARRSKVRGHTGRKVASLEELSFNSWIDLHTITRRPRTSRSRPT